MRMRAPLFLLLALSALPTPVNAQGFGIGARLGTLGLGAEAALGLSDSFVLRAGLGTFSFFDLSSDYEGVEYTVTPPSTTGTVGIDLYPAGSAFRLMAGIMFRAGDWEMDSGDLAQGEPIEIGDNVYSEAGTLHGVMATRSTAPFVGLGFGHHTEGGFGFFLDLGVAFVGEADVTMTAQGPIASADGFQQDLDTHIQEIEDDYASYMKYWPIINLGVKIPIR